LSRAATHCGFDDRAEPLTELGHEQHDAERDRRPHDDNDHDTGDPLPACIGSGEIASGDEEANDDEEVCTTAALSETSTPELTASATFWPCFWKKRITQRSGRDRPADEAGEVVGELLPDDCLEGALRDEAWSCREGRRSIGVHQRGQGPRDSAT
jgi:hypothetical protein